ncbi:Crp/Fnr family transcriptional regulator [Chitinimonas sp. PSY-7]|uniref:cyclic nucleotide-binding domain-containing protein n=1 Tax=Chitinimonas sp. PSY-7 TaxID=3459088 RepID=UPI00403FEE2E
MPTHLSHSGVLDKALLQLMVDKGGTKSFPANAMLINEADTTDSIYIILAGRVKVFGTSESGREVIYNTLGPGEYFGELSLDGKPRSASVITLAPTNCIVVSSAQLRDFLAEYPDFALHLIYKLIDLLRRKTANIKSLALEDVHGRIIRVLESLAQDENGRKVIHEKLTQQDLADRVGASREMVNRVLTQLSNSGHISTEGRHIVLLKPLSSLHPLTTSPTSGKRDSDLTSSRHTHPPAR